ncbi:MAG TPA: Nramp family divalent metal transporter [Candidatus Paceibacterota bacterium]|jgi:manganese transport protein|nr:Nramp family divalent metal transporter [Candidatus Paceibacterota bacterium]
MRRTHLFESIGWEREHVINRSLPEVYKSVPIPKDFSFWRKMMAFAGPGFLVAVGYMDPGNWATDLAGGAKFGYTLLSVILISNFFAMLLQHLALKLGIVTGRDLAQMCREQYSKKTAIFLWLMAEIMIMACDLAEVLGSAIALNLLFGIPIIVGVLITALDVLLILLLQNKGFRYIEAVVVTLIATIFLAFLAEIILSAPAIIPLIKGFIPTFELAFNPQMLYIAIGILGATVMPHNLYLHSAIVQTRNYEESEVGKREAVKFATIDSTAALFLALFVNAAILIVSAAVFYYQGYHDVAEIADAYKLLAPLLGTGLASILFAVALLASGQNATITGTLAGQIIMEGFINLRVKPWLRRMITRLLAIIPAVVVIGLYGNKSVTSLLILSQVILSIQLSFAVFPLVMFTSSKKIMGNFANSKLVTISSWTIALCIASLNGWLIFNIFT